MGEKEIAKVIYDLAQSSSENREDFKNIYIAGAQEFQINQLGKRDKRVVLIYVPYPSLKSAQKLHFKIVNEIQKRKSIQGYITARRIRHKLNGKLTYKIWVNEENKPYLEDRADAITQIYENLTHRSIDI